MRTQKKLTLLIAPLGFSLFILTGCSWISGSIEKTDLSLKAAPTTDTAYQNVSALVDFKASNQTLPSLMSLTRASTGTYCDAAGSVVSAAVNTPRYDYDCNTLALKGLLLEPAATNVVTRSEALDHGAWTSGFSVVVTPNSTLAPDGTMTADTVDDNDGANTSHRVFSKTTGVGTSDEYVASIFAKQGTASTSRIILWFLVGGVSSQIGADITWATIDTVGPSCLTGAGTCGVIKYPNGWYRVWGRGKNNSTGNTEVRIAICPSSLFNASTGTVYLWGAQLERGWVPTSYISTNGATGTRSADNLLVTPSSAFSTSWALVMNFSRPLYELAASASTFRLFDMYSSANPTTQTTSASYNTVSTKIDLFQNGSSTAILTSTSSPATINQSYILTASQQPTSVGLKLDSDTAASLPGTYTVTPDRLAVFGTSSATQTTGHLKELRLYDQINTTLQTPN